MGDSGFVYLWFDKKHRRYYVGAHWGPQTDGYVCSSDWMRRAYKRRPHDFRRRIVAVVTTSRANLLAEEARWLAMIRPSEFKARYYNLKNTADHLWFADEDARLTIGQKIGRKLKGRKRGPLSKKTREAIRKGKLAGAAKRRQETGFSYHEGFAASVSAGRKGSRHTTAHKKQLSAKMRKVRASNPEWDHTFEKKCPECGEKFMARESQKYCSRKCSIRKRSQSWASHSRSFQHVCEGCGEPFNGAKRQRFCSGSCYATHRWKSGPDAWGHKRLTAA